MNGSRFSSLTQHPFHRAFVGAVMLIASGGALSPVREPGPNVLHQREGPGARLGHALTYMDNAGLTMLFGGFLADGQPRGDLWAWTGTDWRRTPETGPSPRRWPAMAYDSHRDRLILHGGRDGIGSQGRPLDDTWEWNGVRWRLIAQSGPGARDHHRIVYDVRRDRIVLFGGWDGQGTRADTWELDNDTWRSIDATGPSARAAHGMSYDASRGYTLLFGGSADTVFHSDTWRWDGLAWTRVNPADSSPPPRSFHGMAYHPAHRHTVIAGGRRGADLYGDTWTFDGERWQRANDNTLPARYVYDLTYDSNRQELVFHGGGYMRDGRWTLFDDTWVFRDARWRLRR